ncbi:methyltransferase domain-containing protein [Hyaloraphidium curvatum]|nr:methyltransferase domain-containing protein [Hyaloraphidium curvatum]
MAPESRAVVLGVTSSHCVANPYLGSWTKSTFDSVRGTSIDYMLDGFVRALESCPLNESLGEPSYSHVRFNVNPIIHKRPEKSYFGGTAGTYSDGAKWVCEPHALQSGCVVYSVSSNANTDFEMDILKHTPCEIVTLDCTVDPARFAPRDKPRVKYLLSCLGTEKDVAQGKEGQFGPFESLAVIAQRLGHSKIDLLKIDIEGHEYALVESWAKQILAVAGGHAPGPVILPFQVLFELHFSTMSRS